MATMKKFEEDLDLTNPVCVIKLDNLDNDGNKFVAANNNEFDIQNVEKISSYNWLGNAAQPCISKICL